MIEKSKSFRKQIMYSLIISLFVCSIYFYNQWHYANRIEDKSLHISTISSEGVSQNTEEIDNQINEFLLKLKQQPNNPNLLLKIAILYKNKGLYTTSAEQLFKANQIDSSNPAILNELGITYYYLHNYDKALNIFEKLNKVYNNSEYKQNLAFVLYKKGNLKQASHILNEVDIKSYNNYEIPMLIGNIYLEENNIPQAIEYYKKSISMNPKSASLHYNLGVLLYQINNEELAIKELKTAKQLDNTDSSIKFELGKLYNKGNRIDEAKTFYLQSTESKDNILSSKAYSQLGEIYYLEGLYSNAINTLRSSVSRFNNNFDALVNLGNIFYDIGQTKKSLYFFEQAKKISPNDASLNFNLANVYFDLKEYSKASTIWEDITTVSDIDEYTAYKISKALYYTKKYNLASEYANKTTELDPLNIEYKLNLGNIYLSSKNFDSAIEQFNFCLNSNSKYNYLNKVIGTTYYNYGNFSDALEYLNKYMESNNKDSSVYDIIGEIYFRNNDIDSALHYWNQAYKINPQFINNKLNQNQTKLKSLPFQDSEKFLLSLLQIDGTNTQIRLNLANLYKANGDVYKAINQWENVISIDYNNTKALENLSRSLIELGETQEATKYMKQLVSINPNNLFAAKNLAKMYFDNNNFNRVIDILKPVIVGKSVDQETLYIFAVSSINTGNSQNTSNLLNRIIKMNPNSIYGINSKSLLGEVKGNSTNISDSLLSSTDLYTKTIEEANRQFALGDYNAAIIKYKEAIKINPELKEPYFSILSILKVQGRIKDAQRFAQKYNLN